MSGWRRSNDGICPPLARNAVGKQKEKQEREQKSVMRAKELAAARAERQENMKIAQEKADIARKEKQEAIARKIEVGGVG